MSKRNILIITPTVGAVATRAAALMAQRLRIRNHAVTIARQDQTPEIALPPGVVVIMLDSQHNHIDVIHEQLRNHAAYLYHVKTVWPGRGRITKPWPKVTELAYHGLTMPEAGLAVINQPEFA